MNKTIILLAALLAASISAHAQTAQDAASQAAEAISQAPQGKEKKVKPNYWKNSLSIDVGLNQTQLSNWAAGGYNSISISTGLDAKAAYSKNLSSWNNRLQLQYGFLYSDEREGLIQKNADRIYLESKFGYKTGNDSKWSYSATADFRSQFSNEYKYQTPKDGETWMDAALLKSGLLSPGYINLGLGMDWTPTNWFNVNMAPLTASVTVVQIDTLRKSFGMELKQGLPDRKENYKSAKFSVGAQMKANIKLNFNDKIGYESQLAVFSNYLDRPWDMRVNWDNSITWQIAKYFKMGLQTWLIYDPDVLITENGVSYKRGVQFKEFVTFNLTWTLSN